MKVFIGYDPRQPVAFQVCAQSVWERASKPVEIIRLDLSKLPIKRRGLTEFTYSRFLVPYLSGFEGVSLFLDSDILVRGDVHELNLPHTSQAGLVMGAKRFEWASVMLFLNSNCRHLTPEYIEREKMFDFEWVQSIAALPKEWNHLVGYDPPNPDAKIVHYTMGVPIWNQTQTCEFAKEWHDTYKRMNSSVSFEELMGRSVHVPHLSRLVASA